MNKLAFILFLLFALFSDIPSGRSQSRGHGPDVNGILYVDSAAAGNSAGDSWENAIPQLSVALRAADSLNHNSAGRVKQIWVAKGTYRPLYSAENGHHKEEGGRNNAFLLLKDVKIYGGFAGMESTLNGRDTTKLFTGNRTILSGNIPDYSDCFHVVVSAGDVGSAKLAGFVITGGYANGSDNIIINGNGSISNPSNGGGIYIYGSSPVISHCIISKNYANKGGGIYVTNNSSPKIVNCLISENNALSNGGGMYNKANTEPHIYASSFSKNSANAYGGGIFNSNAFPELVSCSFNENLALGGGGMANFTSSEPQAINCIFSGNSTSIGNGGGLLNNNSQGHYTGCLFSGNKAKKGGAMSIENSSTTIYIYNCTIAGNQATETGGGGSIYIKKTSPVIRNSIIWGNNSDLFFNGFPDIKYSIVQSPDRVDGHHHNLNQDPLFVNPVNFSKAPDTGGDYRLRNNSPALNKGTNQIPSYITWPDTDLTGNARVSGLFPDMGAYEVQKYSPGQKGIFYVNRNVSGGNGSGNSWTNAFKELSDALLIASQLNKAHPGTVKQIWVARGKYFPLYSAEDGHRTESSLEEAGTFYLSDNAFVLLNNVKIYGGFAGTESSISQRDTSKLFTDNQTILDGQKKHSATSYDKSYHVIIAAGIDSALLDGFVIQNGNAVGINKEPIKVNGQTIYRNVGGGIDVENSSISIERCKFSSNYAVNMGGGFHSFNSSFTIADGKFENNHAVNYGGALSLHNENALNCFIINSSFTNNKTSDDNSLAIEGGGAIYNHSGASLHITSCNFKENSTPIESLLNTSGGAIYNYESSPQISSCSFDSNYSGMGGAIYNRYSSPTIENCSFNENEAIFVISGTSAKEGSGGAIYNTSSTSHIINCSFFNNEAYKFGGAITNYGESTSLIAGCVFRDNRVREPVPDIQIEKVNGLPVPITHSLFEGGDVFNDHSKSNIINCTIIPHHYQTSSPNPSYYSIANNNNSETKIVNSILWGNDEFEIYPAPGTSEQDNKTEVSYSIIQMQTGSVADGEGNLNQDPLFADPANGRYNLMAHSPAIGVGTISISQYHLPDADIEGNPRIADGKINMGAFASTFVHPTSLTATYDERDTVTITWRSILPVGEAYVGGDNFKLERSTDSTFQNNVKTVTSTQHYDAGKTNYSIIDDITDISGGTRLFYRLTRTSAQNQDWQRPTFTSVDITIEAKLNGDSARLVSKPGESPKARVTWEPFEGVWVNGTQFSLIKKNTTDGTQQIISLDEEQARQGYYIDDNIPTCKEIRYAISVKLGNHYASPSDDNIADSILTKELASISGLTASKGYYPDRTTLRWSTTGTYDHYTIERKVYGSSDNFLQVVTVDGAGLKNLLANDDKGTPGVYYQYAVTGLAQCSNTTLHSDTIYAIGFRSPTGTVYGRVTYEKGGGAVRDATVRMESKGNTKLGKSVHLDGQSGSYLILDSLKTSLSDSAFTIGVWVKPEDKAPKSQIIFSRQGQYRLGFDDEGKLYFGYHGNRITGTYEQNPINGWIHLAGIHHKDSLVLMINDTTVIRQAIIYQPAANPSNKIYIGGDPDGGNFKGYIDEMRLWNMARDSEEIAKDGTRLLTGGEPGLTAYWRFDASIKDQFYDLSHKGDQYNQNDGTMDSVHVKRSEMIPSTDQLSLKAYTDSTGNYTITGIPYTGVNGTTYAIAPKLGTHVFDPVVVTRIFSSGSSTFTLDFKDKSSYIVSGYVTYKNTEVPVKGVQFKIDGNYAFTGEGSLAQTDEQGYFEISVPVGEHEVQAIKANHVFINGGKIINSDGTNVNYQNSMANVQIHDSTQVRFIGRVAGGAIQTDYPLGFSLSKNILGDVMAITLELKTSANYKLNTGNTITKNYRHVIYSDQQAGPIDLPDSTQVKYEERKIVIYPDPATGEFEANLIPADFKVTDVRVSGGLSLLKNSFELNLTDSVVSKKKIHKRIDTLFDPNTGKQNYSTYYDTVKYNASYIFPYRVDPMIMVKQSANPGNPNTVDYFGNKTYSYSTMGGDKYTIPVYNEENKQYIFDHPAFRQNVQYGLKISSFEIYPYYNKDGSIRDTTYVPSRGGLVTITNDLKAGSGSPDTIHLQNDGSAYYTFVAGEPELADGIGLKGFAVSVQIGSQYFNWNKGNMFMCYVFGGRPTGQDFTTTGPKELIGILRDPPGSGSYSYIKKGSSINITRSFSSIGSLSGSLNSEISSAPKIETINGVGVAVATEINTVLKGNISVSEENHWKNDSTYTTTTTFEDNFQTSSDPSFIGAMDDIFIGRATDITYGATLALIPVPLSQKQSTDSTFFIDSTSGYAIVQRTGLHAGQNFKTLFAYPQYFIINNLIPNLIKIRNSILSEGSALTAPQATANAQNKIFYVSKINPSDSVRYGASNNDEEIFGDKASDGSNYWDGPSYTIYFPRDIDGNPTVPTEDTIMSLDQSIKKWKHWLSENEKAKVNADYSDNYSFGSGAAIDHSEQIISDTSYNNSFSWVVTGGLSVTKGIKINNVGLLVTVSVNGGGGGDSSRTTTTDTSTTIGFHLEETGSDYMTVDVGQDPKNFYLFRTKGGVTSCPYEGGTVTQYYNPGTALDQPTVQREMPEITVDKPVVSGIAANRKASYTIHLRNTSSVKGDIYFGLKVIDKSNPYGAKVYMDGSALGAGRNVLIPAGETLTKTITLEKGPDSMNYNNIQLILHSTCQYNPVVYSNNIADTISLSAHFLPACSDIHLSSPTDQWLLNTGTPVNKDGEHYLPVVLDKYDLNKNLFDHIALQYKPSTSPNWVTVMKFYTDSTTYKNDKQGGAKTVIQAQDETDYNLVMNAAYTDGKYDIRAVSVCMDNGQPVAETPSNTVSGIKDIYTPRLFGNPQPANGILGIGDDVKLTFNEPIDAGFLNHNNFTVQAIKNGVALDSLVSVQLDGQNDYAQTEFDKNMTGKDFSVAMWVMPDKKQGGTLFSQGNKNESIELSLTNDYYLQVILGNKTYKSDHAIKYLAGQWVHLALIYHAVDSTVSVFYNFNKALEISKTNKYKGIGPFVFGKSLKNDGNYFAGKMRNARVWTKTLTSLQLQVNSGKLLSGSENHLLACYPMSEGKGNVLFDKAHGNNATFTGEWKMPEGKSIHFEGEGHARLNTSQAVITPEMDFTLSVWFKAEPEQTNATIISTGKGNGEDLGGSRNLYSLGFENKKLTFWNNDLEVQAGGNYLDNKWHHVVIAANRNTGTAQLYVDGTLQKYFDANSLGGLASTFTYLGARAYHKAPDSTVTHFDQYFKGNIDEVRIWDTYLNSTLVTKNDNMKLTGKETGLLAYYPFEKHLNYNGVWSTVFTLEDQKIQKDTNNKIPSAILVKAAEDNEKAPMKDPGPKQDLRYDFVVNNDAIVFNFTGGMDEMKAIDKTIVTFTANDVKDMHGNLMASPVTWTAYIDQNPLSWSDETLNLSKDLYEPKTFETYIVNSGGNEETFHITNLPPWLTADITSGTVPPEGKQKIVFTINEGLNVGSYDDIIEMTNDIQETQGLALNVKVIGNTPDWKVDPGDFKYNMSIYGKIRIDGIFSEDKDDMLAAFINGKCVGVTHNTYFKDIDLWYAFLPVYSNDVQNNHIEFRIWDASTGKIYEGIPSEPVSFTNDGVAGNPDDPVIFDGKELLFRNISLNKGWNWLSFDLVNKNLEDINTALANGSWMSGDIIKQDIRGFDQYSSHNGWIGTLPELDNTSLFKLKTGKEQTLSISGTLPDLKNTPITVKGNQWNYISYLPQANMTLKEALADYQASSGDEIKSQTGFSMYSTTKGWVGNLTYLEPGKGYMLFRKAQSNTQFVYPNITGSLDIHRLAENGNAIERLNPYQDPVPGNFSFSDNMTMIATVGKEFTLQPNDHILAFTGNDLRGKAKAMNNTVINKPSFFLNISGQQQLPVYFCIERGGKIVAKTEPVVAYFANSRIGSLKEPFMLHFNKTDHKSNANEVTLYPNPFKNKVEIEVNLKTTATHKVQISVWNAAGQLIYQASEKQILHGYYHTTWNGKTTEGYVCTPGVYFVHIRIDDVSQVYKVIKY